jgi:SHS2 domain-containing protein
MKRYEYPYITTSDICFKAYGKTLSEMFANAGLALMDVTVDVSRVKGKVERKIEASGRDLESLMFNWLTELIFHIDSEGLAFSRIEVEVDEKSLKLRARAWGEEIDPERHHSKTHVKAATYHKMEIRKERGEWTGQVILDV